MAEEHDSNAILARAQNLLRGGTFGSDQAIQSGRIETPVAVLAPEGSLHSWFVPVTVGNKLNGFFQFLPDGTFMRFSSFQRRPGDLSTCPAAADWLDPVVIKARAEVQRRPNETTGRPFLTYDRTPDRLVWAVPFTNARGEVRLVYVAGETVYMPPPDETYG